MKRFTSTRTCLCRLVAAISLAPAALGTVAPSGVSVFLHRLDDTGPGPAAPAPKPSPSPETPPSPQGLPSPPTAPGAGIADQDAPIEAIATEALNAYTIFFPARASSVGLNRNNKTLGDYRKSAVDALLIDYRRALTRLGEVSPTRLTDGGRVEQEALRVHVRSMMRFLETTAAPSRDPNFYVDESVGAVQVLADRAPGPPASRAETLIARMEALPAFFSMARENLGVCSRPAVKRAIVRLRGSAPLFSTALPADFKRLLDPILSKKGIEASEAASKEVAAFAGWLEKERLPAAGPASPLGEKGWRDWLASVEDASLEPAAVVAAAEKDVKRLSDELRAVAARISKEKPPEALVYEITMEQLEPAAARASAEKLIGKLWEWTAAKKPTEIPSQDLAIFVRETPAFRRRDRPIRADLPGGFDQGSTSWLEIGAPDPDWPTDLLNAWLYPYGRHFLPLSVIREAYPGRFLAWQRMKDARIRTGRTVIFPTLAEGWPLYAEEMTLGMGFGADDPKLRLAMLVDMIRADERLIASVRLHAMQGSVGDAAVRLVREGFWTPAQAASEAEAALADPDIAAGPLGRLAILALRDELKRSQGESFQPRAFHERLLSYGSVPISALRRVLLPRDSGGLLGTSR